MGELTYKYKLDELQKLWLDELPKWYKRKKGKTKVKKVAKLHNVYALNCNRLLDFEKIKALLEQGFTQKYISSELNISSRTIERRVKELRTLQEIV